MPQITFTQFHNKLAQVLGTHQHVVAKASVKTVTASSVETESEEGGAVTKSTVQEGWEDQCSILPDKGSPHKFGSGCGREFPD